MKSITGAQYNDKVSKRELENKEISYNAALEGIVLLENNGVLPLKENNIALYGKGAGATIKGGTGSGEVNERHNTTILEGLENKGYNILTKDWINKSVNSIDLAYKEYVRITKTGDGAQDIFSRPFLYPDELEITNADIVSGTNTAIYVIARQSGEGTDKVIENGDFDLTDIELKSIDLLTKSYKNVIIVLNAGSSMNLSTIKNMNYSALIFFCQQGMEGGRAFADLVSGCKNFSAKLTDTWANNYADIPFGEEFSYLSGDSTNEFYKENIYVGYKYYERFNVKPLFPFGYGLSYTTFNMELVKYSYKDNLVNLDINVKNVGNYKGKEVVEVYAKLPNGKLDKEIKRLVGFAKTKELDINEEEIVNVKFDLHYLTSYDEELAAYILDKGNYTITIGDCSTNTEDYIYINIDNNIILRKTKNICPKDVDFAVLTPNNDVCENKMFLPTLYIKESEIKKEKIEYVGNVKEFSSEVNNIYNELTKEDKISFVMGGSYYCLLAGDSIFTPGTVGRTYANLTHKGLAPLNMADGPAGLRLLREAAINKDSGEVKMIKGIYPMKCIELISKWEPMFIDKVTDEYDHIYQYTTSFPVATAIAQSWNYALAKEIGYAISREMDEYNISYFLAPGMNIHKNPLCGRNFEYYSEDPILSGKIASAIVEGVQKIEGNYATIKHFACNNSEFTRVYANAHISERALREIYLRGFEIAVKEGKAKSLMTSYNLINGIYTANSYDLLVTVLRNEWGFNGLVMTDWSSTFGDKASASVAIKVGNDLMMPGHDEDKEEITKAYDSGLISEEELKMAVCNVIEQVLNSNVTRKYKDEIK